MPPLSLSLVEQRLAARGLKLPKPPRPAGAYEPWLLAGNLLYISAQLPIEDGQQRFPGRVGAELTEVEARHAAALAALNVLAQINAALGGFERLQTLLRVEGHVAAAPGWNHAPRVLDGASEVFALALDTRGRHTRSAFTPATLPLNHSIELVVTAAVLP